MKDYEDRITVQADPQDVFEYVSDLSRLPDYLPTLLGVERLDADRIRVHGNANGHAYDTEGEFHADNPALRMTWGATRDREYHGWLQVAPEGDGAVVTVHLAFGEPNRAQEQMSREGRDPDREIRTGLRKALETLRDQAQARFGAQAGRPRPDWQDPGAYGTQSPIQ